MRRKKMSRVDYLLEKAWNDGFTVCHGSAQFYSDSMWNDSKTDSENYDLFIEFCKNLNSDWNE